MGIMTRPSSTRLPCCHSFRFIKFHSRLESSSCGIFAYSSTLMAVGGAGKEEITPNVNITQKTSLIGRVKTDIRMSSLEAKNSITNVIITNIRDQNCNDIYLETSGPRAGKSTIFEIATQDPFVGPFGSTEYYKLIIRRSENQAVDV